ncbi:MAG: hypothetical protein ABI144_00765 [Gallionella sp.]
MKIWNIFAISGMVVATLAAGSITAAADEMRGDRHDGGMREREGNGGNWRGRVVRQDDRRGDDHRDNVWHGGDWRGPRGPWHGDFRHFDRDDYRLWHRGVWHRSWHDGRYGWWWITGGEWFFYPQPVYPYPDPYNYVPLPAVVVQPQPPEPLAPQPQQYWYYCDAAHGYYPYVATCPGGWRAVPATPPSAPAAKSPAAPLR